MDGQIVIGTKLDTKELEKQLKEQERELQRYEKEAEKLTDTKAKLEVDVSQFKKGQQEARNEVKKLEYQLEQAKEKLKEIQNIDNVHLTMPEYTAMMQEETNVNWQIAQLEEQLKNVDRSYENIPPKIQRQIDNLDSVNKELEQNARNQELVRGEIAKTNQELNKANGISDIGKMLDTTGKKMSATIKKVSKWALAILGIRSVYLGIRQAMGIITQYDKQLSTDIEYMKYALAMSLKPVIEWIIKAFYKILTLIGYIIKQITGKNIFDKAGADKFKKDVDGANKSAKQLKKTLAGFDEVNVLQDTSSSGTGAGTPSINLKDAVDQMTQGDIDKMWEEVGKGINKARKDLLDYQDELHDTLSNTQAFEKAYGIWATFVHGIGTIWEGIVDIVAGVWDTLVGLWNMFMDIITGNFDKLGEDFNLFISGIAELFGGLGELILGLFETILGLVIGILANLLSWIWDNIIVPVGQWFVNLGKSIGDAFVSAWDWIKNVWNGAIGLFRSIADGIRNAFKNAIDSVAGFFQGLWNKVTTIFNNIVTKVMSIGSSFKTGVKNVINFFIDGINKMIRGMNKIQWDVPDWVPFIGGQKWGINISEIPRLASGGIVNMPNRGVMVGNAIAGESGREGVIPLTDPNAMALLGREIGQWVNLAIDNKMVVDGRVLATATNNQLNKESFLMNR